MERTAEKVPLSEPADRQQKIQNFHIHYQQDTPMIYVGWQQQVYLKLIQ